MYNENPKNDFPMKVGQLYAHDITSRLDRIIYLLEIHTGIEALPPPKERPLPLRERLFEIEDLDAYFKDLG
jgi:hypothetical protein